MSMSYIGPKSRLHRRTPEVKVLSSRIKLARIHHELKCGCIHLPNHYYHEVVALVEGQFKITKQHVNGCLDTAVH